MTFSSALQDIQETTLKAVRGLLRKLEYLADLHDEQGGYSHWGISRVYGEFSARRAMAQAHRSLLSRVLATPIKNLLEDVEKSSETAGMAPQAYVERLSGTSPHLLPADPGVGSARHLNSVLHALSSLLKARKQNANCPASWPRPQPGQSPQPPEDSATPVRQPERADGASE
jgi:hypothetical protein